MILTENDIKQAARRAHGQNFIINEGTNIFDPNQKYDLFISHSFRDKEYVVGLYYLFNVAGYKVYIDWIEDNNLDREYVTYDTAVLIKERIKSSKATVYVSTTNSTTSKWCPWELGVADGLNGKVCILPVMKTPFKGREYLGLYPYLEYAENKFTVQDHRSSKKSILLREWLEGCSRFQDECYF